MVHSTLTQRGRRLWAPRTECEEIVEDDGVSAKPLESAPSPHTAFRRQVREQALELAADQLTQIRWDQIRIGQIATEIGVSRPTMYAEFGNKDGFGEALVMFEVQRFLTGIEAALDAHGETPIRAVERAVSYTLKEGQTSPVIRAILASGINGVPSGNDSLLPFVTTRSSRMMVTSNEALRAWFAEKCPHSAKRDISDAVDTLIRVVISRMLGSPESARQTTAQVGRIAAKLLPELVR